MFSKKYEERSVGFWESQIKPAIDTIYDGLDDFVLGVKAVNDCRKILKQLPEDYWNGQGQWIKL